MADEKAPRRGGRPGRGSIRNEERARRAKARIAGEAAIIGDLAERLNRDCVYRNRQRLRAEVLVYVLRQLLHRGLSDRTLYEACGESLLGRAEPGTRRPRAAGMVNAMVARALRRSGLSYTDREFRAFLSSAGVEVWKGIASKKEGDLFWQERFGLRFGSRLINVLKDSFRELERRGTPGRAESLDTTRPGGMLNLAAPGPARSEEDRQEAMAAIRRAMGRLPIVLQGVYEVDSVGRVFAVRDAATKLKRPEETIKKYRMRVRELLRRDHVLREELREVGFIFSVGNG